MNILAIYEYTQNNLYTFDPSRYTPLQIREMISLNTFFYVQVQDDTTIHVLDLSLLFLETAIGQINTWSEMYQYLTPVVLSSYTASIPNIANPTKCVRAYYPLMDDSFIIDYLDLDVPEEKNIKQFMYRLQDLCIRKKDATNKVDLTKCIVVINGIVHLPIYFNDQLLIKDGCKLMWSTTESQHPSIVLLDFSDLGGFSLVRFSDCTKEYLSRNHRVDITADIRVQLPDAINLQTKTIFPVVGGTLFFPENIHVVSKHSVVISPQNMRLSMSSLKHVSATGEYLTSIYILQTKETVSEYISTKMWEDSNADAFFIVVNTAPVIIQKHRVDSFYDTIDDSITRDGLLLDETTQSILDYTRYENDTTIDIYNQTTNGILELDTNLSNTELHLALEFCKCKHVDCLLDHRSKNFSLLRIVGI